MRHCFSDKLIHAIQNPSHWLCFHQAGHSHWHTHTYTHWNTHTAIVCKYCCCWRRLLLFHRNSFSSSEVFCVNEHRPNNSGPACWQLAVLFVSQMNDDDDDGLSSDWQSSSSSSSSNKANSNEASEKKEWKKTGENNSKRLLENTCVMSMPKAHTSFDEKTYRFRGILF